MRSHTGARLAARAAGILLCLAASCLPAAAARHTLTAGDGSTVLVWEQKGRSMRGRPGAVWAIGFSVTDASGTHVGVVAPTGDTARDSSPFLALDDAGAPVLVWSRFDGVYNKIAYTRYAGGDWTDFHYLTFGSGDDLLPLIATTASGSYLFYTGSSDRYFFAPLDLASGRLFAPPRQIDLGVWHRPAPVPVAPGGPSLRGGVDVPINNRGCKDAKTCTNGGAGRLIMLGAPGMQGGVDAPIVNARGAIWGSASGDACSHVVLIMPSGNAKTAVVVDFHNGTAGGLLRLAIPAQPDGSFGDTLAESYLGGLCN